MSDFALRAMRADDLEAVVSLIAAHEEEDGPPAREYFDSFFGGNPWWAGDVHMVIVEPPADQPIAVGGYGRRPFARRGILWLRWLYAAPGYRGMGLGRMLLERILAEARALSTRKLYLDTSSHHSYAPAVAVYEHYGFKLEGRLEDYYGAGEDLVIYGLET